MAQAAEVVVVLVSDTARNGTASGVSGGGSGHAGAGAPPTGPDDFGVGEGGLDVVGLGQPEDLSGGHGLVPGAVPVVLAYDGVPMPLPSGDAGGLVGVGGGGGGGGGSLGPLHDGLGDESGDAATNKPFKCPHCEYRTKKKWNLVAHERVHSGDKPFKCNMCEFRATERSTVTKHLRIHTGDKPYTCNQCECVGVPPARPPPLPSHTRNDHCSLLTAHCSWLMAPPLYGLLRACRVCVGECVVCVGWWRVVG
jgi:hypothetical protein